MRYYPKFLLIGDSIGEDTWNLTDLKTPAAFNVSLSDLTASEQRSASGLVVRDRIGTKRTLSLSYNALTDKELRTILQAVSPLYVYITYPDPLEGEATRQFYVQDRGVDMVRYDPAKRLWNGLSLTFVERLAGAFAKCKFLQKRPCPCVYLYVVQPFQYRAKGWSNHYGIGIPSVSGRRDRRRAAGGGLSLQRQ